MDVPFAEGSRARLALAAFWAALVASLTAAAPAAWSAGVVALFAGGYAVLRWTARSPESLHRTVRCVWLVPVAGGLLGPALVGLVMGGERILSTLAEIEPRGAWPLGAAVAALCAAALVAALRWPERWGDRTFVLVVALAALAVRIAYVSWVWMDPVSDFRGMWDLAGRVVEERPEAALTSDRHLVRLHFQRGLPYLLPLRFLFGPSRWAYVLPNCLVTVGSSLLTFLLARRFFGSRAGRAAFVLSLLAVEPVLASGIPTHDIPGAFLTLLAILVFLAADRAARDGAWRRALPAGAGLGLLLPVLDLQRNTSLFLIASFSLFVAGALAMDHTRARTGGRAWRRSAQQVLVSIVLPIAVGAAATAALRATGLRMDRETDRHWQGRAVAAHTDSWSSGRYAHAVEEYYRRFDLDADGWRDLALRKLATDLVRNPEERLAYVLRKSALVFDLGRQQTFYLAGARIRGGETVGRSLRGAIAFGNRCFVVLFLALLLGGSVSVWRDLDSPPAGMLPALYLAAFVGALLLFFQAQPRYAFPIWYLGSIYAGALFRRPGPSGRRSRPCVKVPPIGSRLNRSPGIEEPRSQPVLEP